MLQYSYFIFSSFLEQIQCTFDSAGPCDWKRGGQLKWSSAVGGTRQSGTGPNRYFGYGLYSHSNGKYQTTYHVTYHVFVL